MLCSNNMCGCRIVKQLIWLCCTPGNNITIITKYNNYSYIIHIICEINDLKIRIKPAATTIIIQLDLTRTLSIIYSRVRFIFYCQQKYQTFRNNKRMMVGTHHFQMVRALLWWKVESERKTNLLKVSGRLLFLRASTYFYFRIFHRLPREI